MNAQSLVPQSIIAFWFAEPVTKLWFNSTPQFDERLRDHFRQAYQRAARDEFSAWERHAEGALALTIILDQFPLNMFRGRAQSFATEAKARAVTRRAVEAGLDARLPAEQKAFLYMPLMHSEHLADQDRSVALFEAAALEGNLRFARHHRELIRRFGRFPHRNAILGRKSTPQEIAYLNSKQAFTG